MIYVSPEQANEIVALYKSGNTVKEIANKLSVKGPVVSRILKTNNVPKRSRGRRRKIGIGADQTVLTEAVTVAKEGKVVDASALEELRKKLLGDAEKLGFTGTE